MNNKGQGISINVIVIAALALLVMVVLAILFISKVGTFGVQSGDCGNKGGSCFVNACPTNMLMYTGYNCADTASGGKQICCLPVQR